MKKTNKLFLLLSTIPLSACCFGTGSTFSWDSYLNNTLAMSLESDAYKNYKLVDFDNLDNDLEKLRDVVVNKGSTSTFKQYILSISSSMIKAARCYVICETKYYANADESFKTKAENYYSTYLKATNFLTNLEDDIYHSSKGIKEFYFGDMTDAEIENRLSSNETTVIKNNYDEIFSNYQTEGEKLYLQFKKDNNKEAYLDRGYDLFIRYINKAKELIDQIGFENYLDYSYDHDYNRDYKISDVEPFIGYVKQYLVPIYKEKTALEIPSEVDQSLLNVLNTYNFCNSKTEMAKYFSSYAEEMGKKYLATYNNAFKYGYYCFSGSDNSMTTAFNWGLPGMNDSVLYFSKNYQNILSVVHEFGHYYSSHVNNGDRVNDPYDLQETYSQGNEFVFCNYLLKQRENSDDFATYDYLANSKMYNEIRYIILEAGITEIEKFAYTTPNLTKETLKAGVESILASYDGTQNDTYFMAPCISQPCYYISYATSLVEAMQLAAMNFEDSKNAYVTMIETSKKMSMVERWTNAGLTSPFEEDTFKTLSTMLKGIADKY